MSDFEKFKDNVGVQDIVVHLMNDNIRLQAEMLALKMFCEMVMKSVDPNYDASKTKPIQDAVIESLAQQIVASHPLYSDYMKKQLEGLKGLGADL